MRPLVPPLSFEFDVNRSFSNYPRKRPITIPQDHAQALRGIALRCSHNYRVYCYTCGGPFQGRLYHGDNRLTEYFQLTYSGCSQEAHPIGAKLRVTIDPSHEMVRLL